MVPFAVVVTWHANEGTQARIEAIFAEMAALTQAEPGCLVYQPHRSADEAGVYLIYEQFVDEAAFTAHLGSEHYGRLVLEEAVPLLAHRARAVYIPIGAG